MAKRIYRNDMAQAQKDKIAAANTGKQLSPTTRAKISRAMAKYWATLPYKPGGPSSGSTTASTTTRTAPTRTSQDQLNREATPPPTTPLDPLPTDPYQD